MVSTLTPPRPSFIQALQSIALENADRVCVITSGVEVRYGAFWTDILKTERFMRAQGVQPGHWVSITIKDQYVHSLVSLALVKMGCRQICLPSFESRATNQLLADRLPLNWQLLEPGLAGVSGAPVVHLNYAQDIATQATAWIDDFGVAEDALIVLTSSGTTGSQKLIPVDQDVLLKLYVCMTGGIEKNHPVIYQNTSVEYNIGKRWFFLSLFSAGVMVFSVDDRTETVCQRYGVTQLFISAYQVRQLLNQTDMDADYWRHVQIALSGSKIEMGLLAEIRQKLTQKVSIRYGSTESSVISRATYEDLEVDADSVGIPVPGVSVKIVLADGQVAPNGERGVIGIQSDICIKGYLFDDALNAKHFKDGWFYPGDVGTLTDSGMLLYHGRADDMMIMNGINIFPAEIEKAAMSFPGVLECAAFSMRSKSHGAIPALAVVAADEINLDDLAAYCRQSLGIRAPRKVVQVPAIPRNPQGKVLRIALAENFAR